MTALFITYRRRQDGTAEQPGVDVGGHAGRLYHALSYWFDPTVMFYDLDSLQAGEVFPDELRQALDSARLQREDDGRNERSMTPPTLQPLPPKVTTRVGHHRVRTRQITEE